MKRMTKEMNEILAAPYIIGETAYNHEGDINYLYKMIDDISEIKLNAVKFHLLLNPDSYMQKKHPLKDKIMGWTFTEEQWDALFDYSKKKDLDIIALCDDVESLIYINRTRKDILAVELHSTGLNDFFLLEEASKFTGIVILGVGGSTLDEMSYAINFLKTAGKDDILLMYGFQSYPTDYKWINLSKMAKLRDIFEQPVGYADHTAFDDPNNEFISIMGAASGINILEKHYTPEQGIERVDYHTAVGKERMQKIKEMMELAHKVYGTGNLELSPKEKEYGNLGPMKKAIVAKKSIRKGEELTINNLCFKRTVEQSYIPQMAFSQLLGLTAERDIEEDEIIDFKKVKYEFKKIELTSFTHTGGKKT